MKTRKLISILVALLVLAVPAMAVFTGMDLDATLSNLRRELIYNILAENGITIPFPQRDVHMIDDNK